MPWCWTWRGASASETQQALQSDKFAAGLAASGVVPELDRAARTLPADKLAAFTTAVVNAAVENKTDELRKLVANPTK
jgi:hypothetical protein